MYTLVQWTCQQNYKSSKKSQTQLPLSLFINEDKSFKKPEDYIIIKRYDIIPQYIQTMAETYEYQVHSYSSYTFKLDNTFENLFKHYVKFIRNKKNQYVLNYLVVK